MNSRLINRLGILGVISFLSYASAVIFAPLAYPGYNPMRQAVSDLSAADAPSKELWNQLSSLYGVCGLICLTLICIYIQGRLNRSLRMGIYLFTIMNGVSYVGYSYFPLTTSGYAGAFSDIMHAVVTALVVLLSILSLVFIIIGGVKKPEYRYLAIGAGITLVLMTAGPIGISLAPEALFGIFERFSTMSAAGFNMFLGICLFFGFKEQKVKS